MKTGQIIRIISNQYTVRTQEGEQLECVAMGKLRKGHSPVVGDRVEVERFDAQNGIQRILPRRNALRRPLIANVDQAIIVMSTLCPDFSAQLVDRLIFQICYANIQPILCVTKMDLIDAVEQRALACAGLAAQHRHLSLHRGEQCIRHVPFSGDEHRVAALPVILDLRVDR